MGTANESGTGGTVETAKGIVTTFVPAILIELGDASAAEDRDKMGARWWRSQSSACPVSSV